jgi:hypothetical protein
MGHKKSSIEKKVSGFSVFLAVLQNDASVV